jgi:hypothetical protein
MLEAAQQHSEPASPEGGVVVALLGAATRALTGAWKRRDGRLMSTSSPNDHSESKPKSAEHQSWFAVLAAATGVFAAVAGVTGVFLTGSPEEDSARQPAQLTTFLLERRVDQAERDLKGLQAAVKAQGKAQGKVPRRGRLAAQVSRARQQLAALASDQSALEDALAPDPVDSLKVALLQRDLRNAQDATQASVAAVRADVERQYDLMKFVVGTLGLGLLALMASVAVPTFRDRRGSKAESESKGA